MSDLPSPIVPQGFGVNIHFTDPAPGELDRLGELGCRFVRMDFFWAQIEKQKGSYDFSAYDRLVESLLVIGVRPLFILNYGNDLYDKGAPRSREARDAFVRFAVAAVKHFAENDEARVVWELWNEPNLSGFWPPKASATEYTALALATAQAIRESVPTATVIGPGVSGFDWPFLETVFQSGILKVLDGVSVHPYRSGPPESVVADFTRLRGLIARYAPVERRQLPMVSSEWGYTTADGEVSEKRQAAWLLRMWLVNLTAGVNLSIFYDWRDDGDNYKEREHRFGTVRRDLSPKPAFLAAQELQRKLAGYRYCHRLKGSHESDWQLLFYRPQPEGVVVVRWDSRDEDAVPKLRTVRPGEPDYRPYQRLAGLQLPAGAWAEGKGEAARVEVPLVATSEEQASASLKLGSSMLAASVPGTLRLPLEPPARRLPTRTVKFQAFWNEDTLPELYPLTLIRVDPVALTLAPLEGGISATIENPAAGYVKGMVTLTSGTKTTRVPVTLEEGQTRRSLRLPLAPVGIVKALLTGAAGEPLAEAAPLRLLPFSGAPSGWQTVHYRENAAQPPQAVKAVALEPGAPAKQGLLLALDFPQGWQYVTLSPVKPLAVPPAAGGLVLWIKADAALRGDALRCRLKDATGQTLQLDLGVLSSGAWQPVTIPLDGSKVGASWGGAKDGTLHAPLTWDGLLLVDSASRTVHKGVLTLAALSYIAR